MPNGIGYQQTRTDAINFNGYINYVSCRKKILLQGTFNGKTKQNKIDAVCVEYMLQNNLLHYILLENA